MGCRQAAAALSASIQKWHDFCWLLSVVSQTVCRADCFPLQMVSARACGLVFALASACFVHPHSHDHVRARSGAERSGGGQTTTMRTVIAFFVGIVTAAVAAGLWVLVVQNTQSEQFTFLGMTLSGDKGAVVAGAVALGFVLAALLLLPGRLANAWHRAHIQRQTRLLEERLRALREEHAQLHGGHQRLVEEHGLVLNRVLPSPPLSPTATSVGQMVPSAGSPEADGGGGAPADASPVAATAQPTGALPR
jgi:uncharacterized integral membrane protein